MATAEELAKEREEAKLRRAGLNPDGTPLDDSGEQEPPPQESDLDERESFEAEDEGEGLPAHGPDEVAALREQLETLQQQYNSVQGRIGPTQQELELQRTEARVLRQRLEQAERERQDEIARLKQELEERNNPLTITDLLDEDELERYDPDTLDLMLKIADKVAQRRTPKIDVRAEALKALEEREEKEVQAYRNKVLLEPSRGLHNLGVLSKDPRFIDWAQSDDIDLDSTLNSLLRSRTKEDVDRYAKIASRKIAQFNAQKKSQAGSSRRAPSSADPKVRLAAGMRRRSAERMSDAQRDEQLAEARRLSRSNNLKDRQKAQAILDSLG